MAASTHGNNKKTELENGGKRVCSEGHTLFHRAGAAIFCGRSFAATPKSADMEDRSSRQEDKLSTVAGIVGFAYIKHRWLTQTPAFVAYPSKNTKLK